MSAPRSRSHKTMDELYPQGTSYTDVFRGEREQREKAEGELRERIERIEDRLFIVESVPDFTDQYPELEKAFNRYKEEEEKMLTFEALKKDND